MDLVVGEWQHELVKAINIKKHQRLAKSIFRLGLDTITDSLFTLAYGFENTLKLLSPFLSLLSTEKYTTSSNNTEIALSMEW
jgi:hypothetical protein